MVEHIRDTSCNGDCGGICPICCLFVCKVCGLYEGSLTTECPGVPSYEDHADKVYAGLEDFIDGKWVEKKQKEQWDGNH